MRKTMHRRDFIRSAGFAAATATCLSAPANRSGRPVVLVREGTDPTVSSPGVQWATAGLERALLHSGFAVIHSDKPAPGGLSILISSGKSDSARRAIAEAQRSVAQAAESFVLVQNKSKQGTLIVACGADERGVAYALGEIANRARRGSLDIAKPVSERPANAVRSVMRQFTSELLDKPWFYDREGWLHYLDMLAVNRWNRLDLAFGFGYDSLNRVDDSYFLFFYPFVTLVPGYRVRATNLPDDERDRNLEMLEFISRQTVARGMDFQLGIWMHGYHWPNGHAKYKVEGLTPENHAPYCRDALTHVLKLCPAISSVGLRIHGESGVAEGSYEFWATIFDGVRRCGRTVEIDLHAKGIDEKMIANALATGMPVNLSPKYSAEHFGMPYHQAAIREMEMPVKGHVGSGLMTLSEGSRIFTRYGYADLLREDRKYTVRHRVFSGTQRILLWHDPVSAAAYARAFTFCGSTGADLMEPLTCRGRRGSAVPGHRSGYADATLEPRWDWQKYQAWYRTWGRLMYNPETDTAMLQGDMPPAIEAALAQASRILPLVTTAYLPSAACDAYWPEIYWNQPMAAEPGENPYGDTHVPKVFQNASPLDPQLFLTMNEFTEELLQQRRSGKYSPVEVAEWLDGFASNAEQFLRTASSAASADARRAVVDARIQAGLGRFFASKFRAGVLYAIYEKSNDRAALEESLKQYRAARTAWANLAETGRNVYGADLSVSDRFDEREQWLQRLAGIDDDIGALEKKLAATPAAVHPAAEAVNQVLRPAKRTAIECRHTRPTGFRAGEPLRIFVAVDGASGISAATLHYRHVNQAERYQTVNMQPGDGGFSAEIAGSYTASPYPLQYYFELRRSQQNVWLYPGFASDPVNQPYWVVRSV